MKRKAYIGLDCGSVGIKAVLLDENDKVVKSSYLRNSGIINTTKKCLEKITTEDYEIKGVGITGSGRKFVELLIGGDLVKTEVLAHAIGTINFYPDVKTNLDLGGEDGKIMVIKEGVLTNFYMNEICGAGTGAIIDSISSRLGIPIEDVGDLALQSKKRLNFPGKCGVFLQSSVVSALNHGEKKEDILAGTVRALVHNYLLMSNERDLQPPYVYTGMTSKNKAIVKALEESLKSEVIVPEYSHLMGAIGIGLLTKRNPPQQTKFKGFEMAEREYETKLRVCEDCENRCELTQLYEESNLIGTLGSRCGKY